MTIKKTIGIGIIGAGFRGANTLGGRIVETVAETDFRITALCDLWSERLTEAHDQLVTGFEGQGIAASISLYTDYQALMADPNVDLVMVTTPQYAHRAPALAALEAGKKLYLDKPIAHTLTDAIAIVEAESQTQSPMLLGFTRRYEAPWRKAFELVQNGVIGQLHLIQIRSIIPFHRYFQRWHRRREWSGGALNDKSSHHMDVFNWFAQSQVTQLSAFGGRRVFLPEADAPERCLDCERDCPYRVVPHHSQLTDDHPMLQTRGRAWTGATKILNRFDTCVYHPGADIKDHAIIQIAYENGVLASLFLSFFGPKAPDQETLELVGDQGRIILTRHTGHLDVVSQYGQQHQVIDCRDAEFGSSHFGADLKLIRELRSFYDGASPVVSARNGYEATRMIMATHASIDQGGVTIDMATLPTAKVMQH